MITRRFLLLTIAASLGLEITPLAAQELEEIVVTARKREESILRVPVVATAFTQDSLEQFQTDNLYGIVNRVPGLVMGESVGTVGVQTSLRGIGPTSQTSTVDQSVSLNIDGLSLTQGYAFAAGMFDVAQVEVLKGPQALFYGKNSTAGVISLRSADPTEQFEASVRAAHEFEADENIGEMVVSGPLSESLKLRLAARYSEMNGFFENTGSPIPGLGNLAPKHRNFAPRESWIVRGTALFEPNDFYLARLKLNYVDDRMEGNGGDGQIVYCPDGTGGVPPINIPFIGDSDCSLDEKTQLGDFDPAFWPGVRNDGVPFADSNQNFGSLEQEFAISPELTFTAVTGLYDLKQDNLIRGSGSSNPTIAADFTFENEQLTQELRLTSDFADSPVNFMVGAFYQDGEMNVRNRVRGNTAFGLPAMLESGLHEIDIRSVSAFGQLLWQATEHIEVAAGARWTDEEREHRFLNALNSWNEVDLLVPKIDASNVSPELSLTYMPTDNMTLFAAYRQGFKSGSFNTVVSLDSTTRADFGDEEAKGGEVGLKARLLDGLMDLNLAGYYYEYSDLQVGANELSDTGAILLRTINAASAEVKGIELDFTYNVAQISGLSVFGAVNYNRSRYEEFDNAPCGNGQTIAEGCNQLLNEASGRFTSQDLSGEQLVRAPDWTANLGFDYETDITSGLILSLGASTRYSDEYFTNLVALPAYRQDSYFKTSANVTLRDRDDVWELSLIGNNLSNEITAGVCSNSNTQNGTVFGGQIAGATVKGPAGSDELGCIPERGRELLVRSTWRF